MSNTLHSPAELLRLAFSMAITLEKFDQER
jgi:hypothetical protein